jgi:uncharacterized protein DUF1501
MNPLNLTRRAFLGQSAGGLGAIALAHLLGPLSTSGAEKPQGKAKAVISLFQHGGPSQMDLFDEKPALNQYSGKPYPGGSLEVHFRQAGGQCFGSSLQICETWPMRNGAVGIAPAHRIDRR